MSKLTFGLAIVTALSLSAGSASAQDPGPIGPSPYEAVDNWLKPFDEGFLIGR